MKSIFTRPLFVNPQAYLTIPELSYIQTATPFDFTEDSYSFVINTSGRIEGKLLKTSNDYILHLDLYSIDGNCVLGEFYLNNSELNTDNFNLTQSKNIITLQFGEQSSGNITYPGLIAAWSAKGKTNDDKDRAILKDLTGNGHDITLNGFAFSEMSGYGGFNTNFLSSKKWITVNSANLKGEYTSSKAVLTKGSAGFISNNFRYISYDYLKFRFKTNNNCDLNIHQKVNGISDIKTIKVIKDEFTEIEFEDVNDLEGITMRWCYFSINIDNLPEDGLIIEQIPNYPDALVFDGVDDYGVNENVPILTDYTIIAKRKTNDGLGALLNKGESTARAFVFEGGSRFISNTFSFGFGSKVDIINSDISYQSKNKYNGITIGVGSAIDTNKILLGKFRFWQGVFYSVYLFDRSLDEQEIKAFIRKYIDPEYLLPSEIPTPDCYYDFSKGSNDDENRETIKDYSGNGNDAVAHGFAWSGMSGYGGYPLTYPYDVRHDKDVEVNGNKYTADKTKGNVYGSIYVTQQDQYKEYIVPAFSVKISGLVGEEKLRLLTYSGDNFSIKKYIYLGNGIHRIPSTKGTINDKENVYFTFYQFLINSLTQEEPITIEFLPEYEGALVFDGTDDYVSLDAFDSGFKTMFMVCNPFVLNKILYDQRHAATINNQFAIYLDEPTVAYNARNTKGITYINSVLNNKLLTRELINKKQCITVFNNSNLEKNIPLIGTNANHELNEKMALYKFLGFKEALTEEQIQAVIKKYKLLDGVDEIEVN